MSSARSESLVEIVTTVAGEEEAARIARVLVVERLAACGSWGAIRSVYAWKGRIADEPEIELKLKTTASRAPRAERRLRELHPYETPAILRLAILAASDDYAAWVRDAVHEAAPGGAELAE